MGVSSNCTFMELKFYLWNCINHALIGSNCTFMELKLRCKHKQSDWTFCSNCTFMELKWRKARIERLPESCSNCTFMELKSALPLCSFGAANVQIVPLWNWNMETHWIGGAIIQFKLYLYGIEIMGLKNVKCRTEVQIVPLWNWNEFLSLQEIRDDTVQIVPLWNWNKED